MQKYDAIVIGSGQGGTPLSMQLADRGWSVALVEQGQFGGTCINTGCTPTKTMVASAQIAFYARNASKWGVNAGDVTVDLPAIVARKNRVVTQSRSGKERSVESRSTLHLYRDRAVFLDARRVQVGAEILEGEKIFVNTGMRPRIPELEGLSEIAYLDNASIMELRELPRHLVVLGGGYIGVEFGQMFRRFGSDVTIIDHGAHLLSHEDEDVATELQKVLSEEGIRLIPNAKPTRVEDRNGSLNLEISVGNGLTTVSGSHLLVATGRTPNTDGLGLEKAGVKTDRSGFIQVNNRLETSVPGVWALGDVNGGPAFTHISFNDYQIVYANLIEGKHLTTDDRPVPYCVFTDPQLGRVGMTEKQARATGRPLKVGKIPMSYVARAVETGQTAGLMKLVVDADTDRILGAAILGSEGGELVQTLGEVMRADLPYTFMKGAIYIHPTFSEGFWTLMEEVKPVAEMGAVERQRKSA